MSGSKLDQIVKGAPPPGASVSAVAPKPPSSDLPLESLETTNSRPPDPLSTLPSSPPQIYLNLLILEASLRAQYLTLRARRRQVTFFLLLLLMWNTCFSYALFLRPREDGSGVGGSVYWVVEMAEKVALMGGIVTGILIWGTGQWARGVKWPRRWVGVANRGLRTMNTKIVIIRGPWWRELIGHLSCLFPISSFSSPQGSSYHNISHFAEAPTHQASHQFYALDETEEEDLAPGGDYIKLLLLPKPFSPDFRENWELYRTEYWEKENERRALLRHRLKMYQREMAKIQGGLFWWTKWRNWRSAKGFNFKAIDGEKAHQNRHLEKDAKQRLQTRRTGSHSRTTSRSSTPSELDERSSSNQTRHGNNVAGNERRNKGKSSTLGSGYQISRLTPASSRPGTPPSPESQNTSSGGIRVIGSSPGNES